MVPLLATLSYVIAICWWIVILSAIFSWLYAFNVVNPRNQLVGAIGNTLFRLTEPVYRPIRRFLPDLGGIDLSPIIVLIILFFLQSWVQELLYSFR